MHYQTHTLSNGLRIIHKPFPSEISYCGFAINTGTRDEYEDEHGMAHFVEHMLFKGTKRRRTHHIVNRMENVGGELNAYTTKEETFIYAAFLSEYTERAVELLSDMIYNSEFPQNQVERERDVVLDEINSYIDSPSELIYDDLENMLFKNHDLGHYILGTPSSLESFNSERIKKFVARQYHPSQIIFFSFGKTSFDKVVKLTEKYCSRSSLEIAHRNRIPPPTSDVLPQIVSIQKNTMQMHVMLGRTLFGMHHPDKFSAYLLNHILGGENMNSRLNASLRERNGLVYTVDSNVVFYSDVGIWTIYFAGDKKNEEKCIKLIKKEMLRLNKEPLTDMQLKTAKRQLKGHLGISSQNNETNALAMAKNFLHFNTCYSLDEIFARIDAITASQLQQIANEMLNFTSFSQLKYT